MTNTLLFIALFILVLLSLALNIGLIVYGLRIRTQLLGLRRTVSNMLAEGSCQEGWGPPMLGGQNPKFDEGFLRVAYASCGRAWPAHTHRTLDLIGLCWPLYAGGLVESMSLNSLCAHFGIDRPPVHRALADARAALEVARQMMRRYPAAGVAA